MKKVKCEHCGKSYEIKTGEFNRKVKKKQRFFCSLSCCGKANVGNFSEEWNNSEENKEHLRRQAGNRKDDLSPFRFVMKCCKQRGRELDLTLEDLQEQWQKQNGVCPYLNLPLVLPLHTGKHDKSNPNLVASLDRRDSSKGYVKGNVQFISVTLNFAKNKHDESVLLNLLQLIREGA